MESPTMEHITPQIVREQVGPRYAQLSGRKKAYGSERLSEDEGFLGKPSDMGFPIQNSGYMSANGVDLDAGLEDLKERKDKLINEIIPTKEDRKEKNERILDESGKRYQYAQDALRSLYNNAAKGSVRPSDLEWHKKAFTHDKVFGVRINPSAFPGLDQGYTDMKKGKKYDADRWKALKSSESGRRSELRDAIGRLETEIEDHKKEVKRLNEEIDKRIQQKGEEFKQSEEGQKLAAKERIKKKKAKAVARNKKRSFLIAGTLITLVVITGSYYTLFRGKK